MVVHHHQPECYAIFEGQGRSEGLYAKNMTFYNTEGYFDKQGNKTMSFTIYGGYFVKQGNNMTECDMVLTITEFHYLGVYFAKRGNKI